MKTKFGCCLVLGSFVPQTKGKREKTNIAKQLQVELAMLEKNGYEFAELTVQSLSQLTEEEFMETLQVIQQSSLNIPVFNSFIPPQLKVTGPNVSEGDLENFLDLAMKRVQAAGGEQIIFGSGAARTVPDGFSRERGQEQIKQFLRCCNVYGEKYGLTVAIEPLNKGESNIINTVEEAVLLATELNLPHIKILADSYHMDIEKESFNILRKATKNGWLAHVHISDRERRFPGEMEGKESIDFSKLFLVLQEAEYQGLISAECSSSSIAKSSALSLQFVKNTWSNVQGGKVNVNSD
ncbi:sugar phosphate isomerase/epimerase family protein [Bacillus sp. FSL K6-3431]|uniref:sugar phosphate isomerase/epimerase family protein n=1 Tax=Bacillus sp. FSL K6-3431 TaxID=2921500 RepID=UPI0030FAE7E1